jgi:death-on-curing protein
MSVAEPTWLELAAAVRLHGEQLAEFGGMAGLRDAGLLASALDRPKNAWAYSSPKPDAIRLAASYAFGLVKNHPFVDGNKRASLIACHTFLIANGWMLEAPQQEQAAVILDLAAGVIDEAQFADWLRPRVRQFS